MSVAAIHRGDRQERGGVAYWGGGFLLALGVHAGAALGLLTWRTPLTLEPPPPAAVMLDLAPLPVAPPSAQPIQQPVEQPAEPPPPEPQPMEPPPPEPVIEPVPEPPPPPLPEPMVEPEPPPPPPVVEPEVVLPKPEPLPPPKVEAKPPDPKPEPKPEPKPKPRPKEAPKPVRTVERAPAPAPAVQAPPAPVAAAPAPAPAPSLNRAVPTWQGQVMGHLERHKRYPRSAQARRQEGVAQVRFVIDRQGNVLSARLDKSSGHEVLDEETVDMVRRASPLPAPPPEVAQDRIELAVPVQFFVR